MEWLKKLPWRSLGRWWTVGLAFYAIGLVMLYAIVDVMRIPLWIATLATAEITTVLRFGIYDRWVFRHPRPTWRRLWQFHVACAGGAAIWFVAANILPRFGVHYLLASTAGTGSSVVFSMFAHYLWIWRKPAARPKAEAATQEPADMTRHI